MYNAQASDISLTQFAFYKAIQNLFLNNPSDGLIITPRITLPFNCMTLMF